MEFDHLDYMSHPILHAAQFSRDDVMAVCEISGGVLKGILDRKQVQLQSDHNPGTGRRRMFTGGDILKINTAVISGTIGFPLRWAYILADRVMTRASGKLTGTALEACNHFALGFYPDRTGEDWAFVPILDGVPASPLPIASQRIDVDRLIDETVLKLTAIVDEEPIPSFAIPEIQTANPYSPENDFFRMWDKDSTGRLIRTGLTHEESLELIRLEEAGLTEEGRSRANGDRYLKLHGKHEQARFARLAAESAAQPR